MALFILGQGSSMVRQTVWAAQQNFQCQKNAKLLNIVRNLWHCPLIKHGFFYRKFQRAQWPKFKILSGSFLLRNFGSASFSTSVNAKMPRNERQGLALLLAISSCGYRQIIKFYFPKKWKRTEIFPWVRKYIFADRIKARLFSSQLCFIYHTSLLGQTGNK